METQNEIEQAILRSMEEERGYVTIPYLAQVTGSAPEAVQQFVHNHPEKIRESRIKTEDGNSLYTLNTPLSGIADAWAAFRFTNSKKY